MHNCPICHIEIRREDMSVIPVGNSKVHKDCYDRVKNEADKQGATIHFLWRGMYCTEYKLVQETSGANQ